MGLKGLGSRVTFGFWAVRFLVVFVSALNPKP